MGRNDDDEDRDVAPLPARAVPTLKLPVIAPFDSPESIVQALTHREVSVLTAGLVQLEKHAIKLVSKPAPRANPDLLLDYLAKYPTVDGVFTAWDTAHKTNNSQLSAAVLSALSALIRLISTDPFASEPEIIRRLLSQYGSHLDRALNPGRNDVTVAALKLCNVVVGFGSGRYARRLFGCMQWSPKIVSRLFRTRLKDSPSPLLKPDIRTLLVMLVLAFLAASDSRLKGEVLESKGLISGMLKGLSDDPEVVVNHVLVGIFKDVIEDRFVGLEARRSIFDENTIIEILKLYEVPTADSVHAVSISVHRFLYALTEWLATQINDSQARSFGPQKVLGTILRTLKVTEDSQQRELGLYILGKAPILAASFWARFPSSLDPRLSSRWISSITFATLAVSLPVSPHYLVSLAPSASTSTSLSISAAPPSLSSVLATISPPLLTKSYYSKSLQHVNPLVSFLTSLFLLSALQKASKVLEALAESSRRLEEGEGGRWRELCSNLREALRNLLPDGQIVVALMMKTAVVVEVEGIKKRGSSSKKSSKVKTEAMLVDSEEAVTVESLTSSASQHLRTNVALRMLWLYHRVVPNLISSLRFDFAKLPQAHANITEAEGIRAISSAYALRLAAIHSAELTWSRPGDHYKTTLSPLFQLYRTPSTPSNRHLLVSILNNLLQTPLLFNANPSTESQIWLSALSSDKDASKVLDFFEKSVQKTLVKPLKAITLDGNKAEKGDGFSPLLVTVLAGIEAEVKDEEMLKFLRLVVLGFMGQEKTMNMTRSLVKKLGELLGETKIEKRTIKFLKECVKLEDGGEVVACDAKKIDAGDFSSVGPMSANIFALDDKTTTEKCIASMPVELIFLHVRASDFSDSEIVASLLDVVARSLTYLSTLQILLHRFVSSSSLRSALSPFLTKLIGTCADEKVKRSMKELLLGAEGLVHVFNSQEEGENSVVANLVASVLSVNSAQDIELAQPFCDAIMIDLPSPKAMSKSKSKKQSVPVTSRVLSSATLVPYFNAEATLPFFDNLLSSISPDTIETLLPNFQPILEATLAHVMTVGAIKGFSSMWTRHFIILHRLSLHDNTPSAAVVLALGAEALLPFSISSSDTGSTMGFKNTEEDVTWRAFASTWTTELLSAPTLGSKQSAVLATLIHRSTETRNQFTNWIDAKVSNGDGLQGAEAAVRALLEVAAATRTKVELPSSLAERFVERVLGEASTSEGDIRRVIQLLVAASTSTATAVNDLLTQKIPTIDRDSFTPAMLRLVSDLVDTNSMYLDNFNSLLNATFAGLVRRFAEDEEDTAEVLLLVKELNTLATKHVAIVNFKGHLLDPLITAAITRRLDQFEPISLAATLCRGQQFKSNEVTRHLNNIFASSHFQARNISELAAKKLQSAIVSLVVLLSSASVTAAASSRVLEKMMPFYGGTLSGDDTSLLLLFQKIEVIAGSSISAAFRLWNPSLDLTPVESSRAGSLGVIQIGYVRRSWLRACASTRTVFPREHIDITYDPHFLLSYVSHTIAEDDLKPQDWTSILESGTLGLAVAALASSSDTLRAMARSTLAITLSKIESSTFREMDEVVLVLSHARNCVYSSDGEAIPAISALFLANCIYVIGTPESPMYPAFSRFLLQRPLLDQKDVPMFYILFYSTSEEPVEDHKWLLRFLAEGLVRTQDWKIYRRRQTFELLSSLLQSSRQDLGTRKLVLQFILRATSLPQAARELLSRNGLLGWVAAQVAVDAGERRLLISIINNAVDVLSYDRPANVSDALDALLRNCGTSDVSSAELINISQIVIKILTRSNTSSTSNTPSHLLNLDRCRTLLTFVSSRQSSNLEVLSEFYQAVMRLGFTRSVVGVIEGKEDKQLFSEAIGVGLKISVPGIKEEIIRSLLE